MNGVSYNDKFNSENNNINNIMENNSRKKRVKLSNTERNTIRLESKVNKITNTTSKRLGNEILGLYTSRKVSQFVNAERVIDALKSGDANAIFKAKQFLLQNENKESRQDKNKKKKAATKIALNFKKHIEPKVVYRKMGGEDVKKMKFGFELQFNNPIYQLKSLEELYSMLKDKLETETKKVLIMKGVVNFKITLGLNSTWVRFKSNGSIRNEKNELIKEPILYQYTTKDGEVIDVYEETTQSVKTKNIQVYSKDTLEKILKLYLIN